MRYGLVSTIAMAFVASPAVASQGDWFHLLDRLGYLYFADAASLTRTGDVVEVDFLQGNLDSPAPGENARLSYRVDCAARTLQLMRGRYFTDEGVPVPDFELPAAPRPVSVDTVSPGDYFYDFACKGGYRETRIENPFARIKAARDGQF